MGMKHTFYVNPLIELVKRSIEIFQGYEGMRLFISIIVCVFIASVTYPKYHKQSYVIYMFAKFLFMVLEHYNFNIESMVRLLFFERNDLILSSFYSLLVYIGWHVVMLSLFFWCTIGTMAYCRVGKMEKNICLRLGLMIFNLCLICLFASIWGSTLIFVLDWF